MMDDEEYLNAGGNICPFCNSKEIQEVGTTNIEDGVGWQLIECLDCDNEWIDTYALTGFVLPHC
jgi:hypothetical protein